MLDTGFLKAIEDSLKLGEGYVVIQLEPDGLRVTPVMHDAVDMVVTMRRVVRSITRTVWGQGEPLVAAVQAGGEDVLPSSVSPSVPVPTSFLDTANEHLA